MLNVCVFFSLFFFFVFMDLSSSTALLALVKWSIMSVSSREGVTSHPLTVVAANDDFHILWEVAVQLDAHYKPTMAREHDEADKKVTTCLRKHMFTLPMRSIYSWATARKLFEDAINPNVASPSDTPALRRVVVVGFATGVVGVAEDIIVINELQWATCLLKSYNMEPEDRRWMREAEGVTNLGVLYVRYADDAPTPQPSTTSNRRKNRRRRSRR